MTRNRASIQYRSIIRSEPPLDDCSQLASYYALWPSTKEGKGRNTGFAIDIYPPSAPRVISDPSGVDLSVLSKQDPFRLKLKIGIDPFFPPFTQLVI